MTTKYGADPLASFSTTIRIPLSISKSSPRTDSPLSAEFPASGSLIFRFDEKGYPITFVYPLPKGGQHTSTGYVHNVNLSNYSRIEEIADDTFTEVDSTIERPSLSSDYVFTVRNTGDYDLAGLKISYTPESRRGHPALTTSELNLKFPFNATEHCLHIIKPQTRSLLASDLPVDTQRAPQNIKAAPYEMRLLFQPPRGRHNAGAATTFCAESETLELQGGLISRKTTIKDLRQDALTTTEPEPEEEPWSCTVS